jgi:hypothetical protein
MRRAVASTDGTADGIEGAIRQGEGPGRADADPLTERRRCPSAALVARCTDPIERDL